MKRLFLLLCLIAAPLVAAPRQRLVVVRPLFPACSIVTGTPAVTFTHNHGESLAPIAERLQGIGYTYGLAALDTPGAFLSWHKLTLSLSTDHGCSWRPVASLPSVDFPPSIAAAPGDRAYVWSDNRQLIARYDSRGLQMLKAPGAIVGIGIDEHNADHLRLGTGDGVIWDSTNGGDTWDPIGRLVIGEITLLYRFAFDPHDLDHIVSGVSTNGASVTHDGGRTWTPSNIANGYNAFNLTVSPVDGNVVWLMALGSDRHIYRSTDGGLTYRAVVADSPSVTLINGPLMVPHPRDAAVLYFVFGTYFQGYGTDLFRYDANFDRLTVAHNDYHGINSIAFSRVDPHLMYLGLENVSGHD